MSSSAAKFVPQAVVLAVAIYWIWPNVMGNNTATEAKKAATSLEFTKAMLTPNFPEPSKREPFLSPGALATATKSGPNGATAAAKAGNAKTAVLVLNATLLMGEGRAAVINGQIYHRRDVLNASGDAASSYMITDILPDKVVLESQGKSLQLCYPDTAVGQPNKSLGPSPSRAGPSKTNRSKSSSAGAKPPGH